MKRILSLMLVLMLALSSLAVVSAESETTYPFTFRDSCGTEFTLKAPLNRIVVLNRQTAMAVKILGAEDLVIATGDTTVKNNPYLGFGDLPDMGGTSELNIESIIALEPDAVFVHTNRAIEVLEEKLNPLGIPVIRIDNYQPEKYVEEMLLLGELLGKKARAQEFLNYIQDVEAVVADRVANIPDEERKSVLALSVGFLNSNGGYRVFPSRASNGEIGVGEAYASLLAGGVDAASDIEWDADSSGTTVLVEEEYALSTNPDVITLHGTWLGGYETLDTAPFEEVIENVYNISSIGQMKAGKTRDVYIFHTDMLGAAMRHIGALQLSKYLYPELFEDIDVDAYATAFFTEWVGTNYQGVWFYSAKEK
ncbi:MAG: ABC transporter substrate-binding protein [Christensenellales bacterium]|jgi:iron complex transport system substrate-binding protein